jgi:predicted SprT family Zn-dependent metalloprotease
MLIKYLTLLFFSTSNLQEIKQINLSHFLSHSFRYPLAKHYTTNKSFNKLLLQKEELEQKHVHLLQVVESEKTAKWQYTQQCEELASEIRKLRAEVN